MSSSGAGTARAKEQVPVLWMDDEKKVVSYFQSFVEAEPTPFDISLEFVTTIEEARIQIETGRFAAFVADCRMDPFDLSVNGAEFLAEIGQKYGALPLFVYSAFTDDPHYEAYLSKCSIVAIASKTEDIDPPLSRHFFFQQLNYCATRFHQVKNVFPELIEFRKFKADPSKFEREVSSHWQKHGAWITAQMRNLGYAWVVVVGNRIVDGSENVQEYPNQARLIELGENYNLVPFAYGTAPQPEEFSSWRRVESSDWYPTLRIQIGDQIIEDDFDTGAQNTHVSNKLVNRGYLDFPRSSEHGHLGKEYNYFLKKVSIRVVDSYGTAVDKEATVVVVENWDETAFKLINPNRQCLIGRDLLTTFRMIVLLDSPSRRTVVRHFDETNTRCPFLLGTLSRPQCTLTKTVRKAASNIYEVGKQTGGPSGG